MTSSEYTATVAVLGLPDDGPYTVDSNTYAWWNPVYDRTLDDCVYGNSKGCIDVVLLRRLEANVDFLQYFMGEHHELSVGITEGTGISWSHEMYLYYAQLSQIVANIQHIRNTGYAVSTGSTVPVPVAEQAISYSTVNTWETVMQEAYWLMQSMLPYRRPLGTFVAGTNYITQSIRRRML